jgi:cytochrome c5
MRLRPAQTCSVAAVAWVACARALAGCSSGGATPEPAAVAYLDDAAFRRSELEASIVNPSNAYSRLRLAHYASGDGLDWDRLPEWNPASEPILPGELDAPGGASPSHLSGAAGPLATPGSIASEVDPALIALGERAFFGYPVQLAPYMSVAVASRAAATRYGLWLDDTRGAGGLVRARMADGTGAIELTCSTCHAATAGGSLQAGLPNARLDVGAALLAAGAQGTAATAALAQWGPGRLDVTTETGLEPVALPDLRPVRWLTHLHRDGTLAQRDIVTLAVRIETLVTTSNDQVIRPPRIVALALAAYVWSLADALPSLEVSKAASPRGAELFASACAGCHAPPGLTGAPVPLATIGTDPTVGLSLDRGTGAYRVPSLHGVGTRGPLLHDGTVATLGDLFDPARTTAGFVSKLHGAGAVPGHPFGLGLGADDRAALVSYLGAL